MESSVFWMVIIELNMARLCKSVPRDWGWMGSRCDWWGNFQNLLRYQNKTDTFLRIDTNRLKGSNFVITILPWCPDFSTSQCLHSPPPWRRWHYPSLIIARLLVIFNKSFVLHEIHWLERKIIVTCADAPHQLFVVGAHVRNPRSFATLGSNQCKIQSMGLKLRTTFCCVYQEYDGAHWCDCTSGHIWY